MAPYQGFAMGDNFIAYLREKKVFKRTWDRDELGMHYHAYRNQLPKTEVRLRFSQALFKMSVRGYLRVIKGSTVQFSSRYSSRSEVKLAPVFSRRPPPMQHYLAMSVQSGLFPKKVGYASAKIKSERPHHVPSNNNNGLGKNCGPWQANGNNFYMRRLKRTRDPSTTATNESEKAEKQAPSRRGKTASCSNLATWPPSVKRESEFRVSIPPAVGSEVNKTGSVSTTFTKRTNGVPTAPSSTVQMTIRKLLANSVYEGRGAVPLAKSDSHAISELITGARYPASEKLSKKKKRVEGERPDGEDVQQGTLPSHNVSPYIRDALKKRAFSSATATLTEDEKKLKNLLKQQLSQDNHRNKFHLLLQIEEQQYKWEISKYATEATMARKHSLLYLKVPGLAEKRPSVLRGDQVFASKVSDGEDAIEYVGYVHVIELDRVGLSFNRSLLDTHTNGMKFNIRFTFNRRPIKLMHEALDKAERDPRFKQVLFPTKPPETHVVSQRLVMKNANIAKNKEQSMAVHNIVLGKTSPIYIIFGPPGTGKTVTMVEAIEQTIRLERQCRILVSALSNSACDLLAERLMKHVDKREIIRVNGASREWKNIPEAVQPISNNAGGSYVLPTEKILLGYRVVVCTFVTAGRIACLNSPRLVFGRIFIDEAGQAMEPECMIAFSGLLASKGNIVVAGDPKQLGPIIRSPVAIRHGLQLSLLQRLMDTVPIYQRDPKTGDYNPQCVTKLVENYRSHERILEVPNAEFYDGDLLVCADEMKRKMFCRWEHLPAKNFPIIFHGVQGTQEREASSPSYFNTKEVKIVEGYVKKILQFRGRRIEPRDIGIVTPYRKQVAKIRKQVKHSDIDVGSVEVFQGQERLAIIISTVRSSKDNIEFDARHHLGFLCDPKRFNVAITRAIGLLIVVGNPRILWLDKCWRKLLRFCLENKAYCGEKFSPDQFPCDKEELEKLFARVTLEEADEETDDEDKANPSWRLDP